MDGQEDFVRSLSEFLALHTEQSAAYLWTLIASFMRGLHPGLDAAAKDEIAKVLKADLAEHQNVPSFLQNYCTAVSPRINGRRRASMSRRCTGAGAPASALPPGNGGSS